MPLNVSPVLVMLDVKTKEMDIVAVVSSLISVLVFDANELVNLLSSPPHSLLTSFFE